MNIQEIANATVERFNPSLTRSIDAAEKSTNPEIVNGRECLIRQRDALRSIVRQSINDAIVADRMCREYRAAEMRAALDAVWACWTQGAELSTAVEMVRPLVTRENAMGDSRRAGSPNREDG